MTALQKALDFIENTNYADFFALMRKVIGRNNALISLENEFIAGGHNAVLPERLRTLANSLLNTPPQETQFLTEFIKPSDFVGRKAELQTLHEHLDAGEASVIVNGLGGIGKTTLARQYVWQFQKNYAHIIWLEQQNTLLAAFLNHERLNEKMYFTTEPEKERFDRLIRALEAMEGKNLLVIDNYERTETDQNYDVLAYFRRVQWAHWRVLFTSRQEISHFLPVRLGFLSAPEATELFKRHCTKSFEETTLAALLQEVGYHTLTVELLAKTYANNFDLENLEELLEIMQKKDFDHALLQELVDTEHHKGYETLYKHLLLLFNMEQWTEQERYILKQFAVLPSLPIKAKQLLDWLQDEKRVYKSTLQGLARKGWLQTENKQDYEMHRLLKILIQKKLGTPWTEVQTLVESIKNELTIEKIEANPLASQWLIEYVENFLANIDFQNHTVEIGYLQHKLALISNFIGNYPQAENYYTQELKIIEQCMGTQNKTYAVILSDLALVYDNQGNYEKAIPLHQEATQIRKEVLGEKDPEYAHSLNNLALVYSNQEDYNQAIPLLQEAIQTQKETLGKKHTDYATSLNNLATIYNNQGKYEEAITLHQEVIQILKEKYDEKHPTYAISLNNLACVYDKQGKYVEAILLYQEALKIIEETYGKKQYHYAIFLRNLGITYYNLQEYKKALSLLEEAYPILFDTLGETPPHTQKCKDYLEKTQKALQDKQAGREQ